MTLGLDGNSDNVEDDGEGDTKFRDDRLLVLGISSTFSVPSPGDIFEYPVKQKML